MATKQRPRIGDEHWEVEWLAEIAIDENGDHDPDRSTYTFRYFKNESKARAFAREIYPQSKSGAVRITPERFVPYDEGDALRFPHAGFWEATADPEWYEGE